MITCRRNERSHVLECAADRKRGLPQINFGLLCDRDGRPVSVSAYPGNITDKETLLPELDRLQRRYGFSRVVMVGDRGMIIKAAIAALRARGGAEWITALKSRTIRKLARQGRPDRFQDPEHEQTLFEIRDHPDFPGERLVACRNPRLAGHRARVRQELLEAAEKALAKIAGRVEGGTLRGEADIGLAVGEVINTKKMKKHFDVDIAATSFSFSRDRDSIDAEAALDGIYIIRTSLGAEDMVAEECVRGCKALTRVERAFRCLKPATSRSGRCSTASRTGSAPISSSACSPVSSNGTCAGHGPPCAARTRSPTRPGIRSCPPGARRRR